MSCCEISIFTHFHGFSPSSRAPRATAPEFLLSRLTPTLRLRTWNILTNTRLLDPVCDAWGKLQPLKMCGVALLFQELIRFNMQSFGVAVKLLCFHYSITKYWATTHLVLRSHFRRTGK